ncbi:hypothetical protein A9G42_00975 [Gilliamella sp. Nev6-6]|nr:hypothetical protein A9G42_00975 [Gilliamella apicola]
MENFLLFCCTILGDSYTVTEDGFDLFRKYVSGWLKYLDKSTVENKYENISRLEKGLAKIRELKNL